MFAIFNCTEGVDWYSLSLTYISAPHISADHDSLLHFKDSSCTTEPMSYNTSTTDEVNGSSEEIDYTNKVTTLPKKEKKLY